jgi:hypothetical protein
LVPVQSLRDGPDSQPKAEVEHLAHVQESAGIPGKDGSRRVILRYGTTCPAVTYLYAPFSQCTDLECCRDNFIRYQISKIVVNKLKAYLRTYLYRPGPIAPYYSILPER